MKDEKNLKVAGDLLEEINEVSKIIPDGDILEITASHTALCSSFFTIYCC